MSSFPAETVALRFVVRSIVGLLGTTLAGCISVDIPTDPGTFNVDPGKVSHLSGAQPLSLKNAYDREAKQPVRLGNNTWVFDLRQMTETAVVMLQRALDKGGVKVVPEGERAMTLRVRVTGARMHGIGPWVQTTAGLVLEARFGGTTLSIPAENSSPMGAQRAYDGAILFALNGLLADKKFIAYVNSGAHFACLWKDTYVVGENVILGERIVKIDRTNSTLGQCSEPGRPTAVEVTMLEGDDRKEAFSYCASANAQVGGKLKIGLYASSARTATIERLVGASPRCDDPQRNPTRVEARFDDERPKPSVSAVPAPAAAAASLAATATPPAVPAAGPRFPQVGDNWTYRLIERRRGIGPVPRTYAVKVVYSSEAKIADQVSLEGAPPAEWDHARGRYLVTQVVSILSPYLGVFEDPSPGASLSDIVTSADLGCRGRELCEVSGKVIGKDIVRVPAGNFDAIKVTVSQVWRNPSGFQGTSDARRELTGWYAPQVKRFVKFSSQPKMGNAPDFDLELMSYQLK